MAFSMQQTKRISFSDVIETESSRLTDSIFEENPNIKSYEEFESAFWEKFNTAKGQNAQISSDDIVRLFNTSECKAKMKENTTAQEYDKAYGDGDFVQRVPVTKTKVVTISVPRVAVPSYTRHGRPVKPYSRGKANPFTPAQILFLKQRTGRPPRDTIAQYNSHFSENPRTSSSIMTKVYRLGKSGGRTSSKTFSEK